MSQIIRLKVSPQIQMTINRNISTPKQLLRIYHTNYQILRTLNRLRKKKRLIQMSEANPKNLQLVLVSGLILAVLICLRCPPYNTMVPSSSIRASIKTGTQSKESGSMENHMEYVLLKTNIIEELSHLPMENKMEDHIGQKANNKGLEFHANTQTMVTSKECIETITVIRRHLQSTTKTSLHLDGCTKSSKILVKVFNTGKSSKMMVRSERESIMKKVVSLTVGSGNLKKTAHLTSTKQRGFLKTKMTKTEKRNALLFAMKDFRNEESQ